MMMLTVWTSADRGRGGSVRRCDSELEMIFADKPSPPPALSIDDENVFGAVIGAKF
jgi:hypothetical protein